MKRFWAVLLTMLFLGSLAAGCYQSGEKAPSVPDISQTEKRKQLTLWYYWETEKHQETLDGVINEYNAVQEQVEVSAKYVPFADFKKQLSIGATASELPDVVIIDSPDHASYATMGIFADLTERLEDWADLNQYYEGPLNSCKLNGKLYGIPFGSNCLALFYNEDMLGQAGCQPPTTWEELKEVAKKTTTANTVGLGFCCLQNEEGTFNFLPWLWSAGASSYEIDSEQGLKALSFVTDLVKSGCMNKEVINWTQGDVMNQFLSGNLAMMINGPWQLPTMREQAIDLHWNVTMIPKDAENASVLGGENFGVTTAGQIEEAVDFLKYMTSKENVERYIDGFGYIAARRDVAEHQFPEDEMMQTFIQEMQYAQPRGPHPHWPEISDAISLAVNESITETSSPEAAAAKAQETIDKVLKE